MPAQGVRFQTPTPIDGFGPGGFRVGGNLFAGPIIVTPHLLKPWQGFRDLGAFDDLIDALDIVLIGTGSETTSLPRPFSRWFEARSVGADPMTTPSACRTFNLLLAEGRRIAVALNPI